MYLSKLLINVSSREFRRDHADVHQMHRTVMAAYPEAPDNTGPARQSRAVLWRLDPSARGFNLYVQSLVEPDWTGLPAGYLTAPAEVRSLRPVIEAIAGGRRFAFRLVANPTRTVQRPGDQQPPDSEQKRTRGMRVPHRRPEKQLEWLIRKGEQHGFVIPAARNGELDVAPSPCLMLTGRNREEARGPITVEPVRFDGRLVVTDAARFTEAFRAGIGPAKAYGCGLLSLARPDAA